MEDRSRLYCRSFVLDEVAEAGFAEDGAHAHVVEAFLTPALHELAVVRHLDLVG